MSTKQPLRRLNSCVALGLAVCSMPSGYLRASGAALGSSLIRRQHVDIDAGQVYVYRGNGSFRSAGRVSTWAFFDERNTGLSVTPLLLKVTGKTRFTVTGVGRTRVSAGTGLQAFSFDLI